MMTVGCNTGFDRGGSAQQPVEKVTGALSGENLAGANLAGANLAGNNLAGNNLAGANLAGTNLAGANMGGTNLAGANLAGNNLAGANLAGANLAGTNLAGNNLAGNNLAGTNLAGGNLAGANLAGANLAGANLAGANLAGNNLAGSNLAGSNLAGANLAGNNLAGTNLAGGNLAGANTGMNIHGLSGSIGGMLYSGEDVWATMEERCVVLGIGSTAFSKLLGQQSANATMNVALGKLPWGFAVNAGDPVGLNAWEATVWGDQTYCSFVLMAPNDASWNGVAGFIKAIFRWQAPPTQTMYISGIEASAPYDATLSTSVYTYTGMMDTAAKFRAGLVSAKDMIAGQVAFISATTNNQSVMVDFASWVMDSTGTGMVLGNVQSVNPPTRAESVYYAVDNGDGTVSVKIAAAGSGLTAVADTYEALNTAWEQYQDNLAAKPIPRRCGGALYLNYYYGEPLPAGKCDDGLSWGNASSAADSRKWSTVAGTTSPMNQYMLLPKDASNPLKRGATADDLQVVLSETYVHTWDAASDLATGLTVIDDNVQGTGLNKWSYVDDGVSTWGHSTSGTDAYKSTNSYQGQPTSYATFMFQAPQIQLYMVKDPNHGIAAISIDNGPETMVDLYSPTRRTYQLMWAAANLYPGVNHTLKVRGTGTKNSASGGTNVSIDAAVLNSAATCSIEPDSSFCARQGKNCGSVTAIDNCGATRTVAFCGSCASPMTCGGAGEDNVCGNGAVVDDRTKGTGANQFNFSSGWSFCTRCGNGSLYNSSKGQSKTLDHQFTFAFTGVKVKLYGYKGPTHGIAMVSIDNDPVETPVDFYNATYLGDQLIFTSPTLASGNHTLKVRVTNTKNSASTDTYVVPDRIAVMTSVNCTPESDATFCSRRAKNCGPVEATDNCGNTRSVASCGTCAAGETCGSGICAAPASNLFTNASFASGTSGWITYFYPGAGSFVTDTAGQDGSGSAKFSIPGTYGNNVDWHAQAYQTVVSDGGAYTMSFWFQKAEGTSKKVTAFCTEEGGTYTSWWQLPECTNTTDWTQCSVTCTPPAGKLTKFGVSAAWNNLDVRIDAMNLVHGTGAPPPPPPVCSPESDAAFCTRVSKNCGPVTGTDNCGAARSVSSCGSCTSPQSCGGAGTANVCGCTAETDAAFCSRLAKTCGSVTAADNCGTNRTVASCGSCTSPDTCGAANVCVPPPAPTPYSGTPVAIPGTVQAENYDLGGQGVAYHDSTSGNTFGVYRSDGVDVQSGSCGTSCYNIGAITNGEWATYTVNVATAGTFPTKVRFSTNGTGKAIHLEVDGVSLGAMALPNTGGYANYQDLAGPSATLTAGVHVVKVVFDTGPLNLDSFTFDPPPPPPPVSYSVAVSADAHVRDGAATTNYGSATSLEVKYYSTAGNTRNAFLMFPVPTNAGTPTSVKLRLYGNAVVSNKVLSAYAVSSTTWTESGLTWNTAPAAGTKQGGSVTVAHTTAAWHEFDVTSHYAAAKAAGATSVAFVLKADNSSNETQTSFHSKNNTSTTTRPYLYVTH